MKPILVAIVMFASAAVGQSIDTYAKVLSLHLRQLLAEPGKQQGPPSDLFAGDILKAAQSNSKPSRATARRFSSELLAALANIKPAQLRTDALANSIMAALYSPGANIAAFQKDLVSMGVSTATADSVAARLREVSDEARARRTSQR